ncbi:MAG: hypothetical protein U5L45_16300 [Saprospiraceae bacterium]|nr:hypothetical protein [Saprospiraceae bacterium]
MLKSIATENSIFFIFCLFLVNFTEGGREDTPSVKNMIYWRKPQLQTDLPSVS